MDTKLVVTFKPPAEKKPGPPPPPKRSAPRPLADGSGEHQAPVAAMPPADPDPFYDEVERFAAADPRWRTAIEMAAASLGPGARQTLGVCMSGLEAGPAPRLMPFDFGPDDAAAIDQELRHMHRKFLTAFGVLSVDDIGLSLDDLAAIQGIVTAVHRLLRIAKTRP